MVDKAKTVSSEAQQMPPQAKAAPETDRVKSQKELLMGSARIDERIREEKLDRLIDMADQARKRRRR